MNNPEIMNLNYCLYSEKTVVFQPWNKNSILFPEAEVIKL